MKAHFIMLVAAAMMLPTVCLAQNYQISAPAMQRNFNSFGQRGIAHAGYMQDAPMSVVAPAPSPQMQNHAPMASAPMMQSAPMQGGYCDGGGCDSSFGGGSYFDGGSGYDCGMSGGCADTCCSSNTYFTIFAGYAEMDPQSSTAFQRDLNVTYNDGYALGGAIGRRVGRNLRTELEYTFRSQTAEVVQFNGNFPGNVGGNQNSHSGMFNCVYDLVFGNGNLVPYIGGGIGVAGIDSRVTYGSGVAALDGDDTSIAYQWMVGLTYRCRPNMEMFAEYRFFEVDDPKINRFGGPALGAQPNPNVLLNSEYTSQDVFAGIRFNF